MEKIQGFKINKITLSGFSCFKKETEFRLDDVTMIFGSNHVGKSSIGNAIAFAFTGCTFYGEQKTIDRFYNEDNPDISVKLELIDNIGKQHELVRKRKDDKMSISFDGYSVRQKDLNELFGERDVFLSIFNPLYFIEILGEDGKGLLELYLPAVSHEDVLSGLSEYNSNMLKDESLLSPEIYLSAKREQIQKLEIQITENQAKKELLTSQRQENATKLKALSAEINSVETEISELQKHLPDESLKKQLEEKVTALSLKYEDLLNNSSKAEISEIDAEITKLEAELEVIYAKKYESKYSIEIEKIKAEFESARCEHIKHSATNKNIEAGFVCPQCLREITDAEVEPVKAEFLTKLNEIMQKGQACKAQHKELKKLDEQAEKVFNDFQIADLKRVKAQIKSFKDNLKKLSIDENEPLKAQLDTIQSQIQEYELKLRLGDLSEQQMTELSALEQKHVQMTAEFNTLQDLYKAEHITELTKQSETAQAEIAFLKEKIYAAVEYAAKRAELTFKDLCTEHVKIVLFKVFKTTGEVKNAFQFTYKDRDYKRLSRSEKLLAGMEVSELIKRLTGRSYPMFIDDAESISNIPKPKVQTILSVVKSKTALTVIPRSQSTPIEHSDKSTDKLAS